MDGESKRELTFWEFMNKGTGFTFHDLFITFVLGCQICKWGGHFDDHLIPPRWTTPSQAVTAKLSPEEFKKLPHDVRVRIVERELGLRK